MTVIEKADIVISISEEITRLHSQDAPDNAIRSLINRLHEVNNTPTTTRRRFSCHTGSFVM